MSAKRHMLLALAFSASLAAPPCYAAVARIPAARGRGTPAPQTRLDRPVISVVVPAYLESSVIGQAIRALRQEGLRAQRPLQVIVAASDTSTWEAAADADVRLLLPRTGKAAAMNAGAAVATGDVLLFTDANATLSEGWSGSLLRELGDVRVGLVSAHKSEAGSGAEGPYWKYERKIKELQSEGPGSLAVVGEFLGLRRRDFRPIPEDTWNDDLALAFPTVRSGGRVVICRDVDAVERAPEHAAEQWERRVRIMTGQLPLITRNVPALARTAVGRQFLVHKYYRSTVGAAAFWGLLLSFVADSHRAQSIRLLVALGATGAAAEYVGVTSPSCKLAPARLANARSAIVSMVGMQLVPVAAVRRLMQRTENSGIWRKVPR